MTPDPQLSIGEFARRGGVTVRTLRFWEEKGLLTATRSAAGRRYFRHGDLARLHQILALKSLGLTVEEIVRALNGGGPGLARLIADQAALLHTRKDRLNAALRTLKTAEARLKRGKALDIDLLCQLIEVTKMMDDNGKKLSGVAKRYVKLDPQQEAALKARTPPPDEMDRIQRTWADLISEVELLAADGADPAGPTAQSALARWDALVQSFTGGDPKISAQLGKMYAEQDKWAAEAKPPFSKEVMAYLQKVRAAKP